MNKKIYYLKSDVTNYCSFIQDYQVLEEHIMIRSVEDPWKPFDNKYQAITLELRSNDFGKKNYQFDFSGALEPFFVISEFALTALADILEPRGQVLPVITKSKRKQFFGYYPTNPLSGCFDKEKSVYQVYSKGFVINKPVLIAENITDDYLFSIEEDISRVFVTEKFKQRVEEAGLLAFDFSIEIPTS
ncbi:hypothetical protein [uncultured Gilliamella sp.]|uniref:hypothetical protein n=1 Tax=uncultured Gilliamella sp. TaxID=1193505 RepID=UPI0034440173